MVDIPENMENILSWVGIALALVGSILAMISFGNYASTIRGMMAIILVWFLGVLGYILVVFMMVNGSMVVLGCVLAIVGSGLLLFLKINKDILESGGV